MRDRAYFGTRYSLIILQVLLSSYNMQIMDILIKTVNTVECACNVIRSSVYDETSPLGTVFGVIVSALCKLYL